MMNQARPIMTVSEFNQQLGMGSTTMAENKSVQPFAMKIQCPALRGTRIRLRNEH